jgi:hypothetical protein
MISWWRGAWRDGLIKTGIAYVPVVGFPFALADAVSVLVDTRGRALHDFAAGTTVRRSRATDQAAP